MCTRLRLELLQPTGEQRELYSLKLSRRVLRVRLLELPSAAEVSESAMEATETTM